MGSDVDGTDAIQCGNDARWGTLWFLGPHSRRAFGHLGLINKLCWADPDREIAVALLTSGILFWLITSRA